MPDPFLAAILADPADDLPRLAGLNGVAWVRYGRGERTLVTSAPSTQPTLARGQAMSRNGVEVFWNQSIGQRGPVTSEQIETIRADFNVQAEIRPVAVAPGYAVSADGRVFSCVPCSWSKQCPRECSPVTTGTGYKMARLHINKKSTSDGVHRLVASAFLPPPLPEQTQVRHLDGDPANNNVANLKWGTPAENAQDTIRHGRTLRGRRNPNAKLTERTVRAARLLSEDGYSHIAIGHFLGVSSSTIDRAVNAGQWGHVDG